MPTRLVVWDECSFSRYLREALASADTRTRALVLPPEILHETDSELRSLLRSLIRSSHGTATPVVISCATADSAQGLSGSAKANLEARIAAGRLR